ncbi:MAG: hypothetical protein SGARI_004118, partial [Bacillariaceae sp.]
MLSPDLPFHVEIGDFETLKKELKKLQEDLQTKLRKKGLRDCTTAAFWREVLLLVHPDKNPNSQFHLDLTQRINAFRENVSAASVPQRVQTRFHNFIGVDEATYRDNLAAWVRRRDRYVDNEVALFEDRQEAKLAAEKFKEKVAKRKADQAREAARLEQNMSSSEDELAKGATSGAKRAKPSDNVDSSDYDSDEYDWMTGELDAALKSETISTEEWMKAKRRL